MEAKMSFIKKQNEMKFSLVQFVSFISILTKPIRLPYFIEKIITTNFILTVIL